jgi:hypothetical protein
MKKILAVVLLMIGTQAYAGNGCVAGNVQKIKDTPEQLEFDYFYTLAHNRIYIKTMSIKTNNSIEKSKIQLQKEFETKKITKEEYDLAIKKVENFGIVVDKHLKDMHEKINEKTEEVYQNKKKKFNIIERLSIK